MQLNEIKGIGPKTLKLFEKINIYTINDLVTYYPFRYDIIKKSDIDSLIQDDKIIIDGVVESNPTISYYNKKMNRMNFKINTSKYLLNAIIFNRGFLKTKIKIGIVLTLIGKYDRIHNTIIVNDIRFKELPSIPVIEPIYHQINGLSSNQIRNYINEIKEYNIEEYIPSELIEKYKLIQKDEAIVKIHNPKSLDDIKLATSYFKYEELFLFMLKMNSLKLNKNKTVGLKRNISYNTVMSFINNLNFKLTSDQIDCVQKIYKDMNSLNRMNRLIQGDVGSGKTIVAIISLYINYLSGYQGVLMAPTEILALQHYKVIKDILMQYNINIEILTGALKIKEKKEIYKRLLNNEINILIGTHALFSSDVVYNNLGLVITDEQHRFGVVQRSELKNKGIIPDILYLSATPIPRTYALTIYGDMDVSSIKIMPKGRKPILTSIYNNKNIKTVLEKMYEQLILKHQIYVVAPLIEESDKIDLENINKLYEQMSSAFSKICKIGIMHGKMDKTEKDLVMDDFQNGKIGILISTTVIEVGVDVENATMIVVFDAYRFGLSQLHQLRGRVGRNQYQSYCLLISNKEEERLNIMINTNDGFKISEEDFKLRGSGDLFGVKQSGDMSFKVANIKTDFNILLRAKEDSMKILYNIKEYKNLERVLKKSINLD